MKLTLVGIILLVSSLVNAGEPPHCEWAIYNNKKKIEHNKFPLRVGDENRLVCEKEFNFPMIEQGLQKDIKITIFAEFSPTLMGGIALDPGADIPEDINFFHYKNLSLKIDIQGSVQHIKVPLTLRNGLNWQYNIDFERKLSVYCER